MCYWQKDKCKQRVLMVLLTIPFTILTCSEAMSTDMLLNRKRKSAVLTFSHRFCRICNCNSQRVTSHQNGLFFFSLISKCSTKNIWYLEWKEKGKWLGKSLWVNLLCKYMHMYIFFQTWALTCFCSFSKHNWICSSYTVDLPNKQQRGESFNECSYNYV